MFFSKTAVLALATAAVALPTSQQLDKRAGMLKSEPYANFQISDGVGGDALAEVKKKFPIDDSKIANIDPADLKIIKDARTTAEKAETDGFDPAIAKATGEEKDELEVGKIKNKVLKLQLEVEELQAEMAQNMNTMSAEAKKTQQAKLTEEQQKLSNNIAEDKKNAGKKSKSVPFNG
ncbi:hypothetical protein MCOR25_002089 [Pyricularia grisea]|uniref:Small secreted protein n=1 Tax=Pyricularia grisea TaxID=148305 RepID=A0A6P8BD24_PYRGI|nr:uncharacterized protein PgNI_03167 [Pyricularia grisea]KAI6379109.1 hypothetical protein MCOR25_002089 [Pyricularia grisea]TLD13776.1 hypothetical protein PgNI_03167 [Pyricularia grisea]